MTAARPALALALMTASSAALANGPQAFVAVESATEDILVLPAGIVLTEDQEAVAAIFQDDHGLREARTRGDAMSVDAIVEDPDGWEVVFLHDGPVGQLMSTYRPSGYIVAIEGGGVTLFAHSPAAPLRLLFTDGWVSPMVFDQADDSTVVTTGVDNLVGLVVPNSAGGDDVVLTWFDPGSLALAVGATLEPADGQ